MITPPSREEIIEYKERLEHKSRKEIVELYGALNNAGETELARKLRCYTSYWDYVYESRDSHVRGTE